MRIFESLEEIPADFGRTVVSVGNYDGIHLAHQRLIRTICTRAKVLDASSLLVIFDPHPARILHPHGGPPLITPIARKLELLAEYGLDAVAVLPFTRDLSMMPAFEFAEGLRQPAREREVVPFLKCPAVFLPEPIQRRIRFKCHGRSMARGKSFVERRDGERRRPLTGHFQVFASI